MPLRITPAISIPDSEIEMTFVRASGAGGQNVHKVRSAVHLRFNAAASPSLPGRVKVRLRQIAGSRMTEAGEIVLLAREHRTQVRNREAALDRLADLIREAAAPPPPPRRATKPTRSSRERRLSEKANRSRTKAGRGRPSTD